MYASIAASTPSHQWANVSLANRADRLCRYASMLRMASACTMARLSGKNWYTEPIATSARSASRVVVRPSYPTSSTSSAQASSMRWPGATLLPCPGPRRSGPVVTVGVDTRRHSLSAVIIGTLLGSTSETHRRDAGDTLHSGFVRLSARTEDKARMTTPVNARRWTNWGGNQHAVAVDVLTPGTVDEVAEQVKQASGTGRRIKAVGSGHSFTAIAVAGDQRLHLHRLSGLVAIDGPLVTVQAGMPLSTLNAALAEHGLAMPNLGDIDAQTVAGAISTGTHGTGAQHATLASCVEEVTLIGGLGDVVTIGRDDALFPAARLGLGALGILVEVTLRCVEAFTLLADERPMPLRDVLAGLDEWIAANDHVEFYWYPYTDRAQLKRNNKVAVNDQPLSRFRGWLDDEFLANTVFQGACRIGRAVPGTVPAISALAARALTARTYTDRSDRVFCTPRRVHFTEMEYAIPRPALSEVPAALPPAVGEPPFKIQFPPGG